MYLYSIYLDALSGVALCIPCLSTGQQQTIQLAYDTDKSPQAHGIDPKWLIP